MNIEQQVSAVTFQSRYTDIQIRPAVIIYIANSSAQFPVAIHATRFRNIGNIFKPEISFIQVKPVTGHIPGKINIGKPVVVKISHRYSPSHIHIGKKKIIESICFCEGVCKGNVGFPGRKPLEQGRILLATE